MKNKTKINTRLADEIKEMFDLDQDLRMAWSNEKLSEPISTWGRGDKKATYKPRRNMGLINYLVYLIDSANNVRIHRIIEQYGYPTPKLIGKKGMYDFWLLIQHQDHDLQLQKDCLEHCDFKKKELAYLTDRVLLHEGGGQLYGTQCTKDTKSGQIISRPIEDVKNVDKRRVAVGLPPLREYLSGMRKRLNGKPKK